MPPQPIPKSIASPALLAHVCTAKYADALPLYRQEDILKRAGIDLPRATLANWMLKLGELVVPLINLLRDSVLEYGVVQMDDDCRDTGGRAMQEQLPKPRCKF
jgi:transposase